MRCVVSVAMLTEGWDANNVTHILGVRAFGSQLLCEQVVGRGLRRMNYTPDPQTELLPEEYVDVYGIPFSVIPYKGKPSAHATRPARQPRLRHAGTRRHTRCASRTSRATSMPSQAVDQGGLLDTGTTGHRAGEDAHGNVRPDRDRPPGRRGAWRRHRRVCRAQPRRVLRAAPSSGDRVRDCPADRGGTGRRRGAGARARKRRTRGLARHELFPQVLRIVRRYVAEKVDFREQNPCELGLEKYVRRIKERLLDAIVPDEQEGEAPLLPILNRYKPIGTTADVDFTTKRNVHSTQRSHVNAVVLDSTWEQTAAFYLEQQTDHVFSYVRNDRPFLLIPYEYEGVQHHYEPDYLVRLRNGKTLILEIKGEEDDQDRRNTRPPAAGSRR